MTISENETVWVLAILAHLGAPLPVHTRVLNDCGMPYFRCKVCKLQQAVLHAHFGLRSQKTNNENERRI